MRDSARPSAPLAPPVMFSGFSRRRHIDLQRVTTCLCNG
ncbi:putative leader peptide [Streptomyces sp. NPDC096132]